MPIFMKDGKRVEIPIEKCIEVPEGWGHLIYRLNNENHASDFNIDGMYQYFTGTNQELKALALRGYKKVLRDAEKLGKRFGLDAEREKRDQAIKWYGN